MLRRYVIPDASWPYISKKRKIEKIWRLRSTGLHSHKHIRSVCADLAGHGAVSCGLFVAFLGISPHVHIEREPTENVTVIMCDTDVGYGGYMDEPACKRRSC